MIQTIALLRAVMRSSVCSLSPRTPLHGSSSGRSHTRCRPSIHTWSTAAILLLAWLLLSGELVAEAQTACPWLTEGTAAAVLGEKALLDVKLVGAEGTCSFRLKQGTAVPALEVTVSTKPPAQCIGPSAKLVGIGNEAVLCRQAREQGDASNVVNGRVRTIYFRVMLSQAPKADDAAAGKSAEAAERVAEQVAGNLY